MYNNEEIPETKAADLFKESNVGAHPFLKWAGGKGQLIDKFQSLYPIELKSGMIKNLYEPFLGGGAVFFDIIQNYEVEKAWLYDANPELVLSYQVIQHDIAKLLDYLYRYQAEYRKLSPPKREEYFYTQRLNYNLQRFNIDYKNYSQVWISRAAQLIFLNRTCFNGLYRVNSKGEFNTPAGAYSNPTICDETNLWAVHQVLQKATIKHADFREILIDIEESSFVYLDPPYRPLNKTSSFSAYNKDGFNDNDQIQLGGVFDKLNSLGAFVMLSNSDPKNEDANDNFFDDLYQEYNIHRIPARRLINANAKKRGNINELIITNYKTDFHG